MMFFDKSTKYTQHVYRHVSINIVVLTTFKNWAYFIKFVRESSILKGCVINNVWRLNLPVFKYKNHS